MIDRRKYLPLAAVAALAVTIYGCSDSTEDNLRAELDAANMAAAEAQKALEEAEGELDALAEALVAQGSAKAIDLVASWATKAEDGETISGWWGRDTDNFASQEYLYHYHRDGSSPQVVISYDANGPQLNVGLIQHGEPLQTDPWMQASRFVSTNYIGDDPEGVTTSREVITGHNLGSEWHAEELTKDYDNAGTLTVGIATDVKSTDGATDQWETATGRAQNISLDGALALPPGRDFLVVYIENGDMIDGSLSGVDGSFACGNANGCAFIRDLGEVGFTAFDDDITFTPDGGTAQAVTPISPGPTVAADYLALGYWLYVPEDVTVAEDYDFGVFASGGDPFEAAKLAGLTGSATYAGSAVGAYYVNKSCTT